MMPASNLTAHTPSHPTSTPARTPRRSSRHETSADGVDPLTLGMVDLAKRSLLESERFYRGLPHDTRFAYELFRRALVEHNDVAWEHIYVQYSSLIESWVRRSGAFASSGESGEYFVGAAFMRFWRSVSARFDQFPTLASLLHYLQLCAGSVVIDSVRAQSWAEMVPEETIPTGQTFRLSPDEEATERVVCEEFWVYINSQLNSEAERVVIFRSFVLGMKPFDIYHEHHDLFQNVNDVYNVKRNVLGRLSRNPELRRLLAS
jgi:hypothetical protein